MKAYWGRYGEDGLDTTKQKYLNDFKFQAENFWSLTESLQLADSYGKVFSEEATEYTKSSYKKYKKSGKLSAKGPAVDIYAEQLNRQLLSCELPCG